MRKFHRIVRGVVLLSLVLSVAVAAPAGAHDGDHSGPGSDGPDEHSRNMKLLSNVEPSAPGVTQSDLAFWGRYAFAGNYQGFRIIDISSPANPKVITDFFCNGAQSDLSVWENLLFQSVDAPQSHGGCDSSTRDAEDNPITAATPGMFEGVRIFDISDPRAPQHIASIQTDCGSHTHTLLPEPENGRVLVYVSSYPLGAASQGPNCQEPHGYISIIEVPLDDPTNPVVHKYFLDEETAVAHFDLTLFGAPPPGPHFSFVACHDISVFKELNLAAGACMSEAQLWDISDPLNPELLWRFDDPAVDPGKVDLWHSAAFSWDGSIVAFGDESGGGGQPRCIDPTDDQGRIWFLDVASGELLANYKIPRSEEGTCTMHNFNFIPLRGRNVLVSAAYTGGTSVVDVDKLIATQDEAASEVGFYKPHGGSAWSSYWYNGFIYANDILRGVDTFLLSDQARAGARKLPFMNPQTQMSLIS
jgi:hypothetical protein